MVYIKSPLRKYIARFVEEISVSYRYTLCLSVFRLLFWRFVRQTHPYTHSEETYPSLVKVQDGKGGDPNLRKWRMGAASIFHQPMFGGRRKRCSAVARGITTTCHNFASAGDQCWRRSFQFGERFGVTSSHIVVW